MSWLQFIESITLIWHCCHRCLSLLLCEDIINYVQRRRWRKALCFWCFLLGWLCTNCWLSLAGSKLETVVSHTAFFSECLNHIFKVSPRGLEICFIYLILKSSTAPYSYQEVNYPIPLIRNLLIFRVSCWCLPGCWRCLLPLVLPWLPSLCLSSHCRAQDASGSDGGDQSLSRH